MCHKQYANNVVVVLQEAYAEHIGIQAGVVLVTELQLCSMQVCSFLFYACPCCKVQFHTCIQVQFPCVCSVLAHIRKCQGYMTSGAWHITRVLSGTTVHEGHANVMNVMMGLIAHVHCNVCWQFGDWHLGSFQICCRVNSLALTITFKKA